MPSLGIYSQFKLKKWKKFYNNVLIKVRSQYYCLNIFFNNLELNINNLFLLKDFK